MLHNGNVCYLLFIHGCCFPLPLPPGCHSRESGQMPRRDDVVRRSSVWATPHSPRHINHHVYQAVPVAAYPVPVAERTCHWRFPVECATGAAVHRALLLARCRRGSLLSEEHPQAYVAWYLPV